MNEPKNERILVAKPSFKFCVDFIGEFYKRPEPESFKSGERAPVVKRADNLKMEGLWHQNPGNSGG